MADTNTPIVVNESALPAAVATALRYGLTMLGGVLITKGFLPAGSDVNAIVGAVLVVASTLYGVWKTKKNNDQKVVMAERLPDSVAKTK